MEDAAGCFEYYANIAKDLDKKQKVHVASYGNVQVSCTQRTYRSSWSNYSLHLNKGFYLEPTFVFDITTSMEMWKEEVFGPVLCVKTFRNEKEAIKLANDTCYGLAGAVISKDLDRCDRVSKTLQAGIVWINCSQPCFCQTPWGGNKCSGFGRELGEWGLDNYLTVEQVTEYTSGEP